MAPSRLLSVLLAVTLLSVVVQVLGGESSSEEKAWNTYNGVFGATPVKNDIGLLRVTLAGYRTTVRDFNFTPPKSQTIAELGKILKNFSFKAVNALIGYVEALENFVSSGNVPNRELFEQLEKPYHRLKKFLDSDGGVFTSQLNELIGCPPSREFKSIFKSLDHQIEYIALAIHRIKEAAESEKDKTEYVQRQATIISNRVVKLSQIIESLLAQSVVQLARRIDDANGLTIEMLLVNSTLQAVKEIMNTTLSGIANLSTSALDVYIAGQLGVRLNLSVSISQLSAFKNFRVLGHLTHEIEESYNHFYHYLHTQNHSDIHHIKESYNKTAHNTKTIINKTTKTFLDVAQTTVNEFIDFFLQGRLSDKCVSDYNLPIAMTFAEFTANITECLAQEQTFWNQTVDAFNCSVSVLGTSTNEVATSLAHCASFETCGPPPTPPPVPSKKTAATGRYLDCISGTDPNSDALVFARAKACLKTNLRDMRLLTELLKPQFEHVDRLIALDVDVSAFRLENCMKTRLNELIAKLKTLRVLLRTTCLTRIDECPLVELCKNDDDDSRECRDRKDSEEGSREKGSHKKGDDKLNDE